LVTSGKYLVNYTKQCSTPRPEMEQYHDPAL
jgi:hypothetical protein